METVPALWSPSKTTKSLCSPGIRPQWLHDGFVTRTNTHILYLKMDSGKLRVVSRAEIPEEDPVTCFSASSEGPTVFTAHKSTLVRQWSGQDLAFVAAFKAPHSGPILHLKQSDSWLFSASSGGDSTVRAWDLRNRTCVGVLRGLPARASCLAVVSKESESAAVGTVEGHVLVGTPLKAGGNMNVLPKKHASPVVDILSNESFLVSLGKDNVLLAFEAASLQLHKVIALFEEMTAIQWWSRKDSVVLTGSNRGELFTWDVEKNKRRKWDDVNLLQGVPVDDLHVDIDEERSENVTSVFQEGVLFRLGEAGEKKLQCHSLHNGQISDADVVGEKYLVVVQGNSVVKCYDACDIDVMAAAALQDDDAVSVSSSKQVDSLSFATTGRSAAVTIWEVREEPDLKVEPKLTLRGHSTRVTALFFAGSSAVTADQDGILKLWRVDGTDPSTCGAVSTVRAHEKEISCLAGRFTPSGSLQVVSGSQDKTAKVWEILSSALLAKLSGHRRNVTCAAFSYSEQHQLVATGSSDLVVKLWNSRSFECVRTLEGLTSWPTNVSFLAHKNNFMLAVTTHGGVLYISSGVGVKDTLKPFEADADESIWGLCVHNDEVVTLGEEGSIVFWTENSEEIEQIKLKRKQDLIHEEQVLANCIQNNNFAKAVNLAIRLDRPRITLKLLSQALQSQSLDSVLDKIRETNLERLLEYVKQWNTKSKLTEITQTIQKYLLTREVLRGEKCRNDFPVAGLRAFNRKHYDRLSALATKLVVVDALLMGR